MTVKVLISRRVSSSDAEVVRPLLRELHALSLKQPGYLSGERFINKEDSEDHLVIASWQSLADWENFKNLPESSEIHNKVNGILGHETVFRTYISG
jgi:quinol monooxygenase YgiN